MALFSWFSKNNNRPYKKSVRTNSNLFNTSKPTNHVTNNNAWPTAKVTQNIDDKLPTFIEVNDKNIANTKVQKSSFIEKHISLEKALFTNI